MIQIKANTLNYFIEDLSNLIPSNDSIFKYITLETQIFLKEYLVAYFLRKIIYTKS